MTISWSHPICDDCYTERVPNRRPFRVQNFITDTCCFCQSPSVSGIYVREDPMDLPCNGVHEESLGRLEISEREERREVRKIFLQSTTTFHRCPNTGRVIAGGKREHNTLCACGHSNPKLPDGHRDTITPHGIAYHNRQFMETANVDEWFDQEEREGR